MLTLIPGGSPQLSIAADYTVKNRDLRNYYAFIVTAACTITFPTCSRENANCPVWIVNGASGPVTLALSSNSTKIVPAGKIIEIVGLRVATGTFAWGGLDQYDTDDTWDTWTSTLTWGTASPTLATVAVDTMVGRYKLVNGICWFDLNIACDDGNGASSLTCSLPFIPNDINAYFACQATENVNGVVTNAMGWIDCLHNTEANRTVNFAAFTAWTNAVASSIKISGFYEVADWTAWTPTVTQAGASTTLVTVARYKIVDDLCFFNIYSSCADCDANTTGITFSLPVTPQHLDIAIPVFAQELKNTTYTDPIGYIDTTQATAASRVITMNAFTTWASAGAEPVHCIVSGVYPIAKQTTAVPVGTYTIATPTTAAANFIGAYKMGNGFAWVAGSTTSADGNACTGVTVKLPASVTAKYADRDISLASQELVNATYSNACGYIDGNNTTIADRQKIQFSKFSTATDAQAWALRYMGIIEV